MSIDRFPDHLVLDEKAVKETDMNGKEHVWLPSHTEHSHWLRMSIQARAEITNPNDQVAMLATRIQEFREFRRTLIQRLLRSTPDNVINAPIGSGGAMVEMLPFDKSRKALLVWAQQTGLHLDPDTVSQLFPNIIAQQELLDAWLVETGDNREELVQKSLSSAEQEIPEETIWQQFDMKNLHPKTPEEIHLQQRIEEEEDSFLRFGSSVLLPLVDRLPEDMPYQKNLKIGLRIPFDMLKANIQNPFRNSAVVRRELQGSEIHFMATMQGISNPNFYGYWVFPAELQQKGIAGFEPMRRTMMLPCFPFEENVFYELIKLHELTHVFQASQRRKVMGLQNYFRFYAEGGDEQRNFLEDEVQAYGQDIEGLNLLLHGKLEERARRGEMLDIDSVHEQLQIPQTFRMPLQMTLFFAKDLYEHNEENGVYPSEFVNHVLRMLIFDGYKVYTSKGGLPQPVVT